MSWSLSCPNENFFGNSCPQRKLQHFCFLLHEPFCVMKSSSHTMFFSRQQQGRAHWCQSQPQAPLQLPAGRVPWATPPCVLWDVPGLQSSCFVKTFSLLSPCWDRAMSCETLGAFLRLCAAEEEDVGQALSPSTFYARVGIWWDNPLIIWFSLWGLFPSIFYVLKMGTFVAVGATPWKCFHQERTFPRLPLFPGYYTDTGSNREQNQLSFRFAATERNY